MPVPSIYSNFRPLMVFNYILAQFTSRNVFGKTSDSLEFSYSRVPFLSFILQSLFATINVTDWLICKVKSNNFIIVHHSLAVAVDLVVVGWLLLSSGDLIKSFKAVDGLRNTLSRFPVRVKQSSPSWFAWLTFTILVLFHMTFPPFNAFGVRDISFNEIMAALFLICFFFRASMTLASLFYSSSLVVQDSVRAWRQNSDVNGRPLQSPEIFCHLLMKFTPLHDVLQKTLSVHVLTVMLYFNYGVLNDTFVHVYNKNPLISSFFKLMSWCLYLGLLILCVDLKSDQHERLSEEIFTSPVSQMSLRELMTVRLLISQCEEGSRKFTATGFVTVIPRLCLMFFSFAMDYYILCEQNTTFLRQQPKLDSFIGEQVGEWSKAPLFDSELEKAQIQYRLSHSLPPLTPSPLSLSLSLSLSLILFDNVFAQPSDVRGQIE
ncbi:hypothetical protein J6590_056167 [Homalodisca vitripennis]|nr:hypothetical protein J6590_056167 [Homalodisca vitripennis]